MGFFAGALALGKTFFGTNVGKMVGTAVLSRALQPKPQPAVLRYAEQTETNDANLEVMRQKAEEAGFNPLTVLRAGGINAYATRKTNIPSYAPQMSKGPSYLAIAAGAAAQSYFNRPTEEQKASQALKIAQQYADLDYTRAMTAGARDAGSDVSMDGREIDGVFFEDLPRGAEPYRSTDGQLYRDPDNFKYMFKGDGFTGGKNWSTSVPANIRYSVNVKGFNPKTHSTLSESFLSIGDISDTKVAGILHGGAMGFDAFEKVYPQLSFQGFKFGHPNYGERNPDYRGLKDKR